MKSKASECTKSLECSFSMVEQKLKAYKILTMIQRKIPKMILRVALQMVGYLLQKDDFLHLDGQVPQFFNVDVDEFLMEK